jgi:hypothetical protein
MGQAKYRSLINSEPERDPQPRKRAVHARREVPRSREARDRGNIKNQIKDRD